MKDTIKKLTVSTMLLALTMTTPVTTSLAMAADGDRLAYSMDYVPGIRGTQASTVSLDAQSVITSKTLPITLSLRDSDVKQVLRMFADKAGLNIIFKGDVSGRVTMDLVNVPLNSAFNMVMTSNDLSYTMLENTLVISGGADISNMTKQEMAIIPVKYVNSAVIAKFLNDSIYTMKKPGLSSSNIASSNPATNEIIIFGSDNDVAMAKKVIEQFDKKPVVTSFKVNHSTPEQMADMICKLLLPSTGGDAGSSTGGAAGIMTGAAASSSGESISLGEGVISCQAKAASGDKDAAGMGLGGITVAYYTQLGTVNLVGGSSQQIEMVRDFIAANDKRQPQAYIEFSLIELNDEGTRTFDNQWSLITKHIRLDFDSKTGLSSQEMRVAGNGYNPVYTSVNGDSRTSLLYTLKLLMENKKGRNISNPRLVVTNGQESTVDMTEDYIEKITTEMNQGSSSFGVGPTVTRTVSVSDDLGVKISVTPFISPDGYVYMNLKPEYTTKSSEVTAPSLYGGQDLLATLLKKNKLDLKNVRVKDGDTLVLAGMVTETESKNVSKTPFLGDIPGIGALFRSTSTTKKKSELVILITPKIITDDESPVVLNDSTL